MVYIARKQKERSGSRLEQRRLLSDLEKITKRNDLLRKALDELAAHRKIEVENKKTIQLVGSFILIIIFLGIYLNVI